MSYFLTKYNLTPEQYEEYRNKVIVGRIVEVVKSFKDHTGLPLSRSNSIIKKEFKVENKLSLDFKIYDSIQRVKRCDDIYNLSIASDIGIILEYAEDHLYIGLNSDILK